MKRYWAIILALLIVFSMPSGAFAAKPGTGDVPFSGTITINPAAPVIDVGDSVTLAASWSANLGINRTQWTVDGIGQTATVLKPEKLSGISSITLTGLTQGLHNVVFRIWNAKYVGKRDLSRSVTVTVNAAAPPAVIHYVSLGDSIALGTTTPYTSPTNPYVDQFEAYLRSSHPGDTIVRSAFETDGDRTNDLLDKLLASAAMRSAVQAADVITISIGGNNLMQACKTWLGMYDFFDPDLAVVSQGYADFKAQWWVILSEIRALNPGAVIVAMNLYNPYNTADAALHQLVDGYYSRSDGTGMNDIITGLQSTYNYHVADAFTAFDAYSAGNMGMVTLLYPDSLMRNPHPTQLGQNLMFALHMEIYEALQ
ncbi:MAG: GDSL-type esterase/lipase family protein [Saccharofermentanales bacterium]